MMRKNRPIDPDGHRPSADRKVRVAESLWALGGLTPWQLTEHVARRALRDELLGRAHGLAFNFVMALFPLLLFLFALFGMFASGPAQLQVRLLAYLHELVPPAVFPLVKTVTDELAAHATRGKLTLGILVALWFASGGVSSMLATLNVIYGLSEARPWWRVRLTAVALTLAMSALLFCSLVSALVGGYVVDWIGGQLHLRAAVSGLWKALHWPAAAMFGVLSFSLIYYYGPDLGRRRWYWITPGSVVGVVLWFGVSLAFRGYLYIYNTYGATYGSVGAAMVLLVWLYVTGLAFLIGGEVNAAIARADMERRRGATYRRADVTR
jgi:membrane protein